MRWKPCGEEPPRNLPLSSIQTVYAARRNVLKGWTNDRGRRSAYRALPARLGCHCPRPLRVGAVGRTLYAQVGDGPIDALFRLSDLRCVLGQDYRIDYRAAAGELGRHAPTMVGDRSIRVRNERVAHRRSGCDSEGRAICSLDLPPRHRGPARVEEELGELDAVYGVAGIATLVTKLNTTPS